MLKIGVLGAGHLGNIHMKLLGQIDQFDLVGFYDPNKEASDKAAEKHKITCFHSIEELLEQVDVVDVVTPTLSHFECAEKAIRNSKHVFIEKPLTNTLDEAKTLLALAHEANVKVQVGHVERFNPAFVAIQGKDLNPMFIETHRLATFNPRGTDVSVVLDLMIHDIDIVLSVVKSNIRRISANGVAVISETPDIANVRMEFDNGCVANLTASRMSMKNMRKTRFFQNNAYISVDFLEKKTEIITMKEIAEKKDPFALVIDPGNGNALKEIVFDSPEIQDSNAIEEELKSFAKSILENKPTAITIDDGYNALNVAFQIIEKLNANANMILE